MLRSENDEQTNVQGGVPPGMGQGEVAVLAARPGTAARLRIGGDCLLLSHGGRRTFDLRWKKMKLSCTLYCLFVCLLIGLQDPTPLTQTHPDFPGMLCIWARWAGCPRRLPNKKLTKSYTRYPVGGASGPVRRSLWPGPAVPGRSMAVHAPDPGLYCAQRLLHSSIALNGRRGSPPFQGLGW